MLLALAALGTSAAEGKYAEVAYPSSEKAGELKLGVTYTLWVPEGVRTLRGVIVHQHGCGAGACQGGATAAYDLHWQALARKWDCALLGPSYQQEDKDDCALWSNPRNGSELAFLRALTDLAAQAAHPELAKVPWILWGHSGGGHWVSEMAILHPDRTVAVWMRSGASALFRKSDEKDPELPPALFNVPMMCNPGLKEKDDPRFNRIWDGMLAMFKAYRQKGAPIAFAPDPRTSHECGDSRYLAIPFLDACLQMRLPPRGSMQTALQPVSPGSAWLAPLLGATAEPAAAFKGKPEEAVWLPDETVARAWMEYVTTGAVNDQTPPPVPSELAVTITGSGLELTWHAQADLESGLAAFVIFRDGQEVARVPELPVSHFARPLFQTMSYHDTPEKPLPEMRWMDTNAVTGVTHVYGVAAINAVGLRSGTAQVKAPK